MIWLDNKLISVEEAVIAHCFSKDGLPLGTGSTGIVFRYDNWVGYIGLKLNTLEIKTSRGIKTFLNISERFLENIDCLSNSERLSSEKKGTSSDYVPDLESNFIQEIFLENKKLSIDIQELARRIYEYSDTSDIYEHLFLNKVFKMGTKRSFREIQSNENVLFDGNIETRATLFTGKEEYYIVNGYIIECLNDEIRYNIWTTPIDSVDNTYFRDSKELPLCKQYISDVHLEKVKQNKAFHNSNFDRREFKRGYWNLQIGNPLLNIGWEFKTSFITENRCLIKENSLELLMPSTPIHIEDTSFFDLALFIENYSKIELNDITFALNDILFLNIKSPSEFYEKIHNVVDNMVVCTELQRKRLNELIHQVRVPLPMLNYLTSFEKIPENLSDFVIIQANPITKEAVYFEVTEGSKITREDNSIFFSISGQSYGFEVNGSDSFVLWKNFKKDFRNDNKGIPGEFSKKLRDNGNVSKRRIATYKDLFYDTDGVVIMLLKKTDLRIVVENTYNAFASEYIFGTQSGYITIDRETLWI